MILQVDGLRAADQPARSSYDCFSRMAAAGPGALENDPGAIGTFYLLLAVFGIGGAAIQWFFLATRSQSIGKMLLGTRIDDYEYGGPASWVKTILLRGIVHGFLLMVPCLNLIYAIADIVFIFGEERRCLHDLIAGTYVVDIS